MSTLPAGFSLLLLLTMVCTWGWIVAETGRRMTMRGSHRRYVLASIEHALRYPAICYLVMSAATEAVYGTPLQFLLDSAGAALWIWLWWEKQNGDSDDDYWSGLRDRLRSWLGGIGTANASGSAP